MKLQIYLDAAEFDLSNVSIANFKEQMIDKKEEFAKTEIAVPPFNALKGDKDILQNAFLNQKAESLNL